MILWQRVKTSRAHLDHDIPLEVVLKPLQLQLQHWRELIKQDTLSRILRKHNSGSLTTLLLSRHIPMHDIASKDARKYALWQLLGWSRACQAGGA
jgi:hypothetical protein